MVAKAGGFQVLLLLLSRMWTDGQDEVGRTRRQYGTVLPGSKHYSGKLERLASRLWATRMACPRSRAAVKALCFRSTKQMDGRMAQQQSHNRAASHG